jgi:hypothetical protein
MFFFFFWGGGQINTQLQTEIIPLNTGDVLEEFQLMGPVTSHVCRNQGRLGSKLDILRYKAGWMLICMSNRK